VWGVRPSYIREGGTIPITRFLEDKLGASAVHLPLGQATDAAHLPNERIRLENLLKGKRVFQHFITELAAARNNHQQS
jgi:di- and tripeptidase